jgi:DNA polymerase-3 subunit delta'
LLKTIEEPPEFAVIFLLTTNVNAFLPTILSRCIKLYMKPVPENMLEEYLEQKLHVSRYEALEAAAFSQGYVGEAEKLAISEEFQDKRKEFITIVTGLKDATMVDIVSKSKEIGKVKEEIPELLNLFTVWFRDVLLYKATESEKELIFTSETRAVSEMSDISYKGLDDILKKISDSEKMLKQNVNPELVTELLLIKIKEIING